MQAIITAKLVTYCRDCYDFEYSDVYIHDETIVVEVIDAPEKFQFISKSKLLKPDFRLDSFDHEDWIDYLPAPDYYLNPPSNLSYLNAYAQRRKDKNECYDFKYTILSVQLVKESWTSSTSNKLARINALLEKSDHDGCCSENDCGYDSEIISHDVKVPKKYACFPKSKMTNVCQEDWIEYLPDVLLNCGGSYYCELTSKCLDNNLRAHDYRYTILSVEIFYEDDEPNSDPDQEPNSDPEPEPDSYFSDDPDDSNDSHFYL